MNIFSARSYVTVGMTGTFEGNRPEDTLGSAAVIDPDFKKDNKTKIGYLTETETIYAAGGRRIQRKFIKDTPDNRRTVIKMTRYLVVKAEILPLNHIPFTREIRDGVESESFLDMATLEIKCKMTKAQEFVSQCIKLHNMFPNNEYIINEGIARLSDPTFNGISNFITSNIDDFSIAEAPQNALLQVATGNLYDKDKYGSDIVVHFDNGKEPYIKKVIDYHKNDRLLVFYSFRHEADRLRSYVKDREMFDKDSIEEWKASDAGVLLVHPLSVGYGVNFQEQCRVVLWLGQTSNNEWWQQANKRLNRRGQKYIVTRYLFITDEIEARVRETLERRERGRIISQKMLNLENLTLEEWYEVHDDDNWKR